MLKDLENRNDIIQLVNSFYDKVKTDPVIGHYFTKVIPVDWSTHLPVMYDFWENVLFHSGAYSGNPIMKHIMINNKSPFDKNHFLQWTFLFEQTVNELFRGANADAIKDRANNISAIMQIKILKNR